MSQVSLAELIPLWVTVREEGLTALVTPALDYVGGLELSPVDVRFAPEEYIATLGEGLRSFVASLDDGCTLLFLYRVQESSEADIREYEAVCANAQPPALKEYVEARAGWLRRQKLRRVRLYLFFSTQPPSRNELTRGQLGIILPFTNVAKYGQAEHARRVKQLATL
ncbi:MAG TPA: hypothetical protein VFV14_01570, partial [Myxococcaceae bacterium]|nr:hypothetical protein [Myxococcaceae bacterium]